MNFISNLQSRPLLCAAAGLLTIVMVAGGARPAVAQAADAADRCTADVMRLCSEFVPDEGRIIACLKSKRKQLTPPCLNALQTQGSGKARKHSKA
ncbi:MAG: cysteine rich repeat-containing protein [Hyphomicrobiales bacterium]